MVHSTTTLDSLDLKQAMFSSQSKSTAVGITTDLASGEEEAKIANLNTRKHYLKPIRKES